MQRLKNISPLSLWQRLRALPRPTPKQAVLMGGLLLLIGLVGSRVMGLLTEYHEVRAVRIEMEQKKGALEDRRRELEAQAYFVSDPDNLEQELRSRFNYKKPSEQVIIVVPPKEKTNE